MASRYPPSEDTYNKDKHDRDEERRSRKLFVGGVSFNTSDEDFFQYFAKYGELEDCVLIREKDTGQSRGFGYDTANIHSSQPISARIHTQIRHLQRQSHLRTRRAATIIFRRQTSRSQTIDIASQYGPSSRVCTLYNLYPFAP